MLPPRVSDPGPGTPLWDTNGQLTRSSPSPNESRSISRDTSAGHAVFEDELTPSVACCALQEALLRRRIRALSGIVRVRRCAADCSSEEEGKVFCAFGRLAERRTDRLNVIDSDANKSSPMPDGIRDERLENELDRSAKPDAAEVILLTFLSLRQDDKAG